MKVAIIPARGGSKPIPRKNIRDFCGKPMIAWSFEAAHRSGLFDHVLAPTNDDEVAEVALSCGADLLVQTPYEDPSQRPALHLYPIQIEAPGGLVPRGMVFRALRDAGIRVNLHHIPVHTQPDYQRRGFSPGDVPNPESDCAQAISLNMYPMVSGAERAGAITRLTQALPG